ncbi:lycopene cyclase [Streptomyces xanthochromogenes]|uniref:lycopene cyclase family protein n=1 Tax=Streptomyces xanthochromogenes TaxID=67384 RepID=UPI0019B2DD74|nr:lycopene cyclase family protein [Streptomyces xanthochromogenes]GHB30414.1 lycopene cyclase [Streptomyces xanthochromogenes]
MERVGVAIIGAGAAGLSLADRLCATGPRSLTVRLIDAPPGPLRPPRRTWCFWESGAGRYDAAVTRSWSKLRVHSPQGAAFDDCIEPLRYKMIRSDDFERLMSRRLPEHPGFTQREGTVERIDDAADGARVHLRTSDGKQESLSARWVFDSRPLKSLPAARTTLLQHFHGWFIRTEQPVFDPARVELMDFRTPQPRSGLAFFYALPTSRHTALVEYTQFSPAVLRQQEYGRALQAYIRQVLGVGTFDIQETESGVIPMTDARFARRSAPSVFRIGAAGGATRPSTGYTFATIQRQTDAMARALAQGRAPAPPRPHSRRSQAMDAVFLNGLAHGRLDGSEFFTRLFSRVRMAHLLRFLDGDTTLLQDIAIGLHTPIGPMLRSTMELPTRRRRPSPRA